MKVVLAAGLALIALAACSATPSSMPIPTPSGVSPTASASIAVSLPPRSSLTMADAASCAVTKPIQAPAAISRQLFGSATAYGNGDLWVGGLGSNGVILVDHTFVSADGSIGWKLGWYRFVEGALSISGRRLDAQGPPVRSEVPDGYGSLGFQSSGIDFPAEGCWEITGSVGIRRLTFVVFVLRTE